MAQLKWNGERWYLDERSLWKRARQWLIWIGGWEKANGKGWQLHVTMHSGKRLLLGPTPISLFGHRVTFYGWGFQVRLWRRPSWYFVWSRYRKGRPTRIYLSHNGTPPRPDEPSSGIYLWPRKKLYWY